MWKFLYVTIGLHFPQWCTIFLFDICLIQGGVIRRRGMKARSSRRFPLPNNSPKRSCSQPVKGTLTIQYYASETYDVKIKSMNNLVGIVDKTQFPYPILSSGMSALLLCVIGLSRIANLSLIAVAVVFSFVLIQICCCLGKVAICFPDYKSDIKRMNGISKFSHVSFFLIWHAVLEAVLWKSTAVAVLRYYFFLKCGSGNGSGKSTAVLPR